MNPTKLHRELREAGIQIRGCNSAGRIDFCDEATPEQRAQAAAILAAHDPDDSAATRLRDAEALERRASALSALAAKGFPGAAEELAKVEAEAADVLAAAKAAAGEKG